MALTRNFLKSMGLTDEQVNAIIENHTDTVEGLKAERDGYKATAEKQTQNEAEITRLTNELAEAQKNSGDAAKVQADFDAFKKQIADEKAAAQTDADVLDIVKEAGIQRESFQKVVAKDFDRSKIQRGEDGTITNRQELVDDTRTRYVDFTATQQQQPLPQNNPPSGGGGGNLSRAAQLVQQYRENLYGSTPTKE